MENPILHLALWVGSTAAMSACFLFLVHTTLIGRNTSLPRRVVQSGVALGGYAVVVGSGYGVLVHLAGGSEGVWGLLFWNVVGWICAPSVVAFAGLWRWFADDLSA